MPGTAALLHAQNIDHYGSQTLVIDESTNAYNEFNAIAVDTSGNLYISSCGQAGGTYYLSVCEEILQPDGTYVETVLFNHANNGLYNPAGVAVDSSGNVYIADTLNSQVLKETLSGGTYTQSVVTDYHGGLTFPENIAVDSSGNVYVTDPDNNRVLKETLQPNGSYVQTTVGTGLNAPGGVTVDGAGNVYIADGGNVRVLKETLSGGTYTQSQVIGSDWLNGVIEVAVDSSGNVYAVNANSGGALAETIVKATPVPGGYLYTLVGANVRYPDGVAVDSAGAVYVTGFFYQVTKLFAPPTSFGSVPVGSTSAVLSFPFVLGTGSSSGDTGVALSMGAPGEFTDAGTGTCDTGPVLTVVGSTCTIDVTFSPKAAGLRNGAVIWQSSAHVPFATAFVSGVGTGPQLAFTPGNQSTVASGFTTPAGVAVDGNGTVYISDSSQRGIVFIETPSGGSYTQNEYNFASNDPVSERPILQGLAIDGAGNLYYSDGYGELVQQFTLNNGAEISSNLVAYPQQGNGLSDPQGLAADSTGNVFIVDTGNNRVVEEIYSSGNTYNQPAGSELQTVVASGLNAPEGVAVDASGKVYIADTGNNRILLETPTGGGAFSQSVLFNSGLSAPAGVAVDNVGDVFISDTGNKRVLVELLSGGSYTQSVVPISGLGSPQGIAVDASGNLFVADATSGNVIKLAMGSAPSLTFASTAAGSTSSDSPQTVTVENLGNAPLAFTVPATGNNPSISTNFTLDSSGNTACPLLTPSASAAGTLAAGSTCTLPISFTPASSGSISGSLVLTDNTLNVPASSQTIPLNGVGTATGNLVLSPTTIAFGNQTENTTTQPYQQISVQNTGSTPITLTSITASASFYQTSDCHSPLAANSTCTIYAAFAPTAVGAVTGTITLVDSDPSSPQVVTVSGNGTPGTPAAMLQPATLTFESYVVGLSSPSRQISLQNYGTGDLSNVSISITGANAGDFAYTAQCSGTYTYHTGCNIQIIFTPSASGTRNATLTVTDNDPASPQTASLTGTGVMPPAAVAQLQFTPIQLNLLAGTGASGCYDTGDGGSALVAAFCTATAVAEDASGNLYVVDQSENVVRKIDSSGNISNFAGTPNTGPGSFSGDGGPATSANLSSPAGVAVDASGNVYIGDYGNARVREVNVSTGVISTLLGGTDGYLLFGPEGLAFDRAGNLFVVDTTQQVVLKYDTLGQFNIVAGLGGDGGPGTPGYNGDNMPGYQSELNFPQAVAADAAGNLYIADSLNYRIRRVDALTGIITTVAGNGTRGDSGDGGAATGAEINAYGVAADLAGDIYISSGNVPTGIVVRKVDTSGNISTFAGGGTGSAIAGSATGGALPGAYGVTVDNDGDLLIAAALQVLAAGPQGTLTFASQAVGTTSAPRPVTIENTGNLTLNFSVPTPDARGGMANSKSSLRGNSITVTGAFAEASGGTCDLSGALAPGATCTLNVTFTPTAVGAATGSISLTNNSAGSPNILELSGTGTSSTPTPAATLTPSTLSFGSQTTDATSTAQVLTLSNAGNAALAITGITIAGANAVDFAQTNTCGSTLAAGANCAISVTFTPASAANFSASLSVADNAGGSPQTAALTGTGVAPPGNFAVNSPTAPQTVTAGGSATYAINVAPTGDGFNGAVTFSASGLPAGATASFNPSSVTPGNNAAMTTMTVQTAGTAAAGLAQTRSPLSPWTLLPASLAMFFAGIWGCFRRKHGEQFSRVVSMALLLLALGVGSLGMAGCGGGFALPQKATPATGTFTITVTGTSGSDQHTTTVTLTVQ